MHGHAGPYRQLDSKSIVGHLLSACRSNLQWTSPVLTAACINVKLFQRCRCHANRLSLPLQLVKYLTRVV